MFIFNYIHTYLLYFLFTCTLLFLLPFLLTWIFLLSYLLTYLFFAYLIWAVFDIICTEIHRIWTAVLLKLKLRRKFHGGGSCCESSRKG